MTVENENIIAKSLESIAKSLEELSKIEEYNVQVCNRDQLLDKIKEINHNK